MKPRSQILMRMYVVFTALAVLPIFIGLKILHIHLTEGDELREAGHKQSNAVEPIQAMRGNILDAAGRRLVVNTIRYDLELDPTVDGFAENRVRFYHNLAALFDKEPQYFADKVRNRASPKYVLLLKQISSQAKEAIEQWEIPGVILHNRKFVRRYNYGTALAHVLGHVDADGNGIAGVEKQYNSILKGVDGRQVKKRDRSGGVRGRVGGAVIPPQHGKNITLTIDLAVQRIVEEELARGQTENGAKWGSAVAIDPKTGAVLAMANVPNFDPNRANAFSIAERRNRAIADLFEPGSTFKLVAAAAAIEQGHVVMTDSIDTGNGYWNYGYGEMWDTHGWGTISFEEAIAVSSNIGVAKVAKDMDRGHLYQYARNLGFSQPTWIDLPGEARSTLRKPEEWSGTTPTSLSIGYETNVTAIQVAAAFSALANGGLLVQPHVLKDVRDEIGKTEFVARPDSIRRAFKRKTARKLMPAFERVVESGTATEAQVEHLRVAGKTGTARKLTQNGYSTSLSRASFAGIMPVEDPQIVLFVIYDEPSTSTYGGVVAAPVFQRIAHRLLPKFPSVNKFAVVDPTREGDESVPVATTQEFPAVRDMPVRLASTRLQNAGYRVRPSRKIDRVVTGVAVDEASKSVKLEVEEGEPDRLRHVMPDVVGLSVRQAVYWLRSRGIEATVRGSGTVTKQWPEAGHVIRNSKASLRCDR